MKSVVKWPRNRSRVCRVKPLGLPYAALYAAAVRMILWRGASCGPAGRLATIQEYIQAGFITPRQGRRAIDFPDLETIESLGNSQKLHPLQEAFIAEENLPNREPSLSRRGLVFAVAGIDGGIDLRVLPPSGDGGPRAGLALGNSVGKPRCASNLVSSRSSVIIEIGTNSAAQEGQSKGSISKTRRKHTAHDLAAALTALEIALSPEATVSISIGWTDDAGCFG